MYIACEFWPFCVNFVFFKTCVIVDVMRHLLYLEFMEGSPSANIPLGFPTWRGILDREQYGLVFPFFFLHFFP